MGEFDLLARVRERLPPPAPRVRIGSGDDAAVTVPGGATATSVDAVVEGIHFKREQATLRQIGHKALATALSDLAAMGAEAGETYVVLGVPPDLDEDDCMELLDGIVEQARKTGTSLAGGDVTRSRDLIVAMTVVGHADTPKQLVTRGGAKPGDAVVLTGEIGGSAAGLLLLERPDLADALPAAAAESLRARQLEPVPRLKAGLALARTGATAMIDLSDGLGGDAGHLAHCSEVGVRIDAALLPLAGGLGEISQATSNEPVRMAIQGGEDYELLAAIPTARLDEAARAVEEAEGIALTRIGEVVAGEGVEVRLPGGDRLVEPEGFDQLG